MEVATVSTLTQAEEELLEKQPGIPPRLTTTTTLCKPAKKKHTFLTIKTKLEILDRLEKGETGSSLALYYGVAMGTITYIKNKKENILNYASKMDAEEDVTKFRKTMRKANDSALDDCLFKWLTEKRQSGEHVNGPQICKKARDLNEELGGASDFRASSGWLQNFKFRHGMTTRLTETNALNGTDIADCNLVPKVKQKVKKVEEVVPSDLEAVNAFQTAVLWFKKQPECTPKQLLTLTKIKELAEKRISSIVIQPEISDFFS